MEINVGNMPLNTLYKFADDSFVWSTILYETRNGNYNGDKPTKYTEVYRIDGNGFMERVASGRLINNPAINDYDHHFTIFDYDKDMNISFMVETPFKEASSDDLYKLRDSIDRSNSRNNR